MPEPILRLSATQAMRLQGRSWKINGRTYRFAKCNPATPGDPPWNGGAEGQAYPLLDAHGRIAMYAKFYKSKNPKRFRRALWLTKQRLSAHSPTLTAAPEFWADSRSIGRPSGIDFDITACCAPAVPGEVWSVLKDDIRKGTAALPDAVRWRCIEDLIVATATLEHLGIVHGDLSAGNVNIDLNAPAHRPALYLIDLDAFVAKRAPRLTLTVEEGGSYGTDGYCPPDLAERSDAGDRSISPYSDRYGRDMLLLELLLYSDRYYHEDPPATWPRTANLAKLCKAAKARCPRPDLYALVCHLQMPTIFDLPEADRPSSTDLLRQAGIAVPAPAAPLRGLPARLPDFRRHVQPLLSAVKAGAVVCKRETVRIAELASRLKMKPRICAAVLTAVFLILLSIRWAGRHASASPFERREPIPASAAERLKPTNQPMPPTARNPSVPVSTMETVYVEPGSFQMGSDNGESDEQPVHTVRIGQPFKMGKYEVTQTQYESLMGTNPSDSKGLDLPVNNVSWNDAVAFCQRLTDRERRAGRLPEGHVYRLPTEAEWEYAARGGVKSQGFEYAGSDNPNEVAWYGENDLWELHPVGRKKPNELGLYDMSGNVGEWCQDWYDPGYYASSPASDPPGAPSSEVRVVRGGHRHCSAAFCRSANRSWSSPTAPINIMGHGFRVVLACPQSPAEKSDASMPMTSLHALPRLH